MWNRKKTIIIAGCSRFGAGLAGELSEHGDDVIIIDKDNDAFRKLPPNFSGFQIVGNVTDPDLLEDAGIGNASVVRICLDSLLRRMESRSVRSRMETVSFCSTSVVTVHRKSLWRLTEMTALTSLTVSECRR